MTGPSQAATVAAAVVNPAYFKKSLLVVVGSSILEVSLSKSLGSLSGNSFYSSPSTIGLF